MASRGGWVALLADRQAVLDALRGAVIGRVIAGARYVELAYAEPAWDRGSFHSIDYGVERDTDDGQTTCFSWQQKGWNETLLTYTGTIRDELAPDAETSTWNVGEFGRGAIRNSPQRRNDLDEVQIGTVVRRAEVRKSR